MHKLILHFMENFLSENSKNESNKRYLNVQS